MRINHLRALTHKVTAVFGAAHANAAAHDATATLAAAAPTPAPRTAFILLGGGARGAAQSGALTALIDSGVTPDIIIGISAGSWNGSFLALDPSPARALQLEGHWIATTSQEILRPNRISLALNAVGGSLSLYGSGGVRRVAERYLAETNFDDLRIPLRIIATDLLTGQPHIFDSGPLLPAVVASSAVPGIFPPVIRDHEALADGGLSEWAGCQLALTMGAQRVFLISCGGILTEHPRLTSFRRIIERAMEISNRSTFIATTFALRAAHVEVIPIFPELSIGHMLDFDHAPQLVQAGRLAAQSALRAWRAGVEVPPIPVRPALIPTAEPTTTEPPIAALQAQLPRLAPSF